MNSGTPQLERPKEYTDGMAGAEEMVAAQGLNAARAELQEKMPQGQPCKLPLAQWRWWTGFRKRLQELEAQG